MTFKGNGLIQNWSLVSCRIGTWGKIYQLSSKVKSLTLILTGTSKSGTSTAANRGSLLLINPLACHTRKLLLARNKSCKSSQLHKFCYLAFPTKKADSGFLSLCVQVCSRGGFVSRKHHVKHHTCCDGILTCRPLLWSGRKVDVHCGSGLEFSLFVRLPAAFSQMIDQQIVLSCNWNLLLKHVVQSHFSKITSHGEELNHILQTFGILKTVPSLL